jgi:hypothetical protein
MAFNQNREGNVWRDNLFNILSYSLLGLVLSYLFYSLVSYALSMHPSTRAFGMISGLRMPTFADFRWVAAISGCNVDLNSLYEGKSVGCDPFGRHGISYPPMSIWFSRFLGVKGVHASLISLVISFSFIGVILSQMRSSLRSGWLLILVGSFFLIGFPAQLGLERMNIDILIFLLLYLCVLLFSAHALVWLFPLIILVIALKYYPFFAFFALMLHGLPRKPTSSHPVPPWLILLIGSCIGLALSLPWAVNGGNGVTVAGGGLSSHGLMALGYLNNAVIEAFGSASGRLLIKIAFGMKILMLACGAYMAYRLRLFNILSNAIEVQAAKFKRTSLLSNFYRNLVVSMTSLWLGCYIITISYDYRMIFLFPMLIFIARAIQLSPSGQTGLMQRRGLTLLLIAMLASMLIPFVAYGYQDPLIRLGIDAIAEFVLIPFYASALFMIVLSTIITARRPSLLLAQS